LEGELAAIRVVREALDAKTVEQLWLDDLATFEVAYGRFVGVKEAARAAAVSESGVTATGKKKVVRKVKGK
jgi:hypothetical protein